MSKPRFIDQSIYDNDMCDSVIIYVQWRIWPKLDYFNSKEYFWAFNKAFFVDHSVYKHEILSTFKLEKLYTEDYLKQLTTIDTIVKDLNDRRIK